MEELRKPGWWNKNFKVLGHSWREKKVILAASLVILVVIFWLVWGTNKLNIPLAVCLKNLDCWWSAWADPLFGLGTFIIAIVIAYLNLSREWEAKIDKKLTVHFKYRDKYIMTCYNAYLAHEGDIRQMSQQIGAQMAKVRWLEFYPYMTTLGASIKERKPSGLDKWVFEKHYEIIIHLRNIPTSDVPRLKKDYLVWWENEDFTQANKTVWFEEHPCKPKSIKEAESKLIMTRDDPSS